jgi:hypothetical protein
MKAIWCTFTHQGLANGTKNVTRGIVVWEISTRQTKNKTKQTNNLST